MSERQLQLGRYRPRSGDIVVVDGHRVGDTRRVGQVLEVLGDVEHPHYRVRWEDTERESLYFPGEDAIVRPRHPEDLDRTRERSATT